MRILINASRELASPNAGGSEVYVDLLARGLTERGHQVLLSAGGPVGHYPYATRNAGSNLGQFARYPFWLARHRKRFDAVVDVANGLTFYSPLFTRRPVACLVHHIHTDMWAEWFPAPVAALGRFLERRAMPFVYRRREFVAVSESTSGELRGLGVAADRINVVHNATSMPSHDQVASTSRRSGDEDDLLFVAVGRLVPHKRMHLLLEQWPEVRSKTGGRLVIVGEGPERDRLTGLLSDGATLAGKVAEAERDRLLAKAAVLLHPSYVEGWGLVVMEAAAQGTPAIGFDVPGVRDSIVAESTGWLCPNLDAFTARWVSAGTDRAKTDAVGEAARTRAALFGEAQLVDAFEKVLLSMTA